MVHQVLLRLLDNWLVNQILLLLDWLVNQVLLLDDWSIVKTRFCRCSTWLW